ncbi:MAG: LacI family transcriptional regulator [Calditrichaeota bacterium]|nr:MAG: LacI family transcriptional regulator [Calditrichota bacterium]
MSSATIKDIAKRLNLSMSTVSRALRGHPDINEETKNLIIKTAAELDYQPNLFAQNLKNRRSSTIGVIVPQVKHVFFAEIMAGITEVAYHAGFHVIISQSNETYEREVINTQMMISQRIAGLLVSLSIQTERFDHLAALKRRGIPIVCFDRICDNLPFSKVVVDDYQGAYLAVEHLIHRGRRRIAHFAGPPNLSIGKYRFNGYRDALLQHQIAFDPDLVIYGGLNEEDGVRDFECLLDKQLKPDAIFCITDPVAIGAFAQLKKNNWKIPRDVALVGFSDNPIDALLEPSLTTVRQPAHEMGETAARLLLEHIHDKQKPVESIVLQTELIIRQSS